MSETHLHSSNQKPFVMIVISLPPQLSLAIQHGLMTKKMKPKDEKYEKYPENSINVLCDVKGASPDILVSCSAHVKL